MRASRCKVYRVDRFLGIAFFVETDSYGLFIGMPAAGSAPTMTEVRDYYRLVSFYGCSLLLSLALQYDSRIILIIDLPARIVHQEIRHGAVLRVQDLTDVVFAQNLEGVF